MKQLNLQSFNISLVVIKLITLVFEKLSQKKLKLIKTTLPNKSGNSERLKKQSYQLESSSPNLNVMLVEASNQVD